MRSLVPKTDAELAMDAAQCIGCGACVAACPNASAMLFVAAKVSHLGLLPQGQPERYTRVGDMIDAMEAEGFGPCSNHGECMARVPEGDQRGLYREIEPRLPHGAVSRQPSHDRSGAY